MRILLLGCYQVLESLLLTDPEARQDVGSCVTVSILLHVKILEHVVHGTAQTVWRFAVAALVAVAEVEVA